MLERVGLALEDLLGFTLEELRRVPMSAPRPTGIIIIERMLTPERTQGSNIRSKIGDSAGTRLVTASSALTKDETRRGLFRTSPLKAAAEATFVGERLTIRLPPEGNFPSDYLVRMRAEVGGATRCEAP